MVGVFLRHAAATAAAVLLVACGGGGDSSSNNGGGPLVQPSGDPPPSQAEAVRFLSQATFGPTQAEVDRLMSLGYTAWLQDQWQRPQSSAKEYFDQITPTLTAAGQTPSQNQFLEAWWKNSVAGQDQLRQRVAFALSQIFVVSFVDGTVSQYPRGVASYYDMLVRNASGNYRQLLEDVTLHPMMGIYLSTLRNQKESGNRIPDQNYAREVMQLFSIGLYELNLDGSLRLDGNGRPIETYSSDDVAGLSRVFTGWSWYPGANPSNLNTSFFGGNADPDRDVTPMSPYPVYHSTLEKRFLTTVIPAQTTADPRASLKTALDALANHPNVAPFMSRQLIQRLVTSNPSPAYVQRVATVWNNNGSGVRGDLRAVVRAILMDPEARTPSTAASYGKLREPVIRVTHWLRAADASSASGRWLITATDDPATSLGQTPMRSSSVFNFYRPGFTPSNTAIAAAGLVAPEMQITNESSVVGYLNSMRGWLASGIGSTPTGATARDVQASYAFYLPLANTPDALVDKVNLIFTANQLPPALRNQIRDAVASVAIPSTQPGADTARLNRVKLAIYLTMASPQFITQK